MGGKLFCSISPTTYKISLQMEIMLRHVRNFFSKDKIARGHISEELPNIVKSHSSILIRRLVDVDLKLQENKVTNIMLACSKINKIVIHPGETFFFGLRLVLVKKVWL